MQPWFGVTLASGGKFGLEKRFHFWDCNSVKHNKLQPKKGLSTMKADIIIDQEMQKVKLILDGKAGNIG